MVDNINSQNYTDINPSVTTTTKQKTFNRFQVSLLNRSMLYAGIGFVFIALIGFAISYSLYNLVGFNQLNNYVLALWISSLVLILISMILSVKVTKNFFIKRVNVSTGLVWAMWIVYIVSEGLGFGILFLSFMIQFDLDKGMLYLMFVFAAGGAAFIIASFIGRFLSVKATIGLGMLLRRLSLGFILIFLVFIIATIVAGSMGVFGSVGLFLMIIGFSTVLFFLYMIYDISVISKTQQFIGVNSDKANWTLAMMFGFSLLVDLVGLIWNIAILVLHFAR